MPFIVPSDEVCSFSPLYMWIYCMYVLSCILLMKDGQKKITFEAPCSLLCVCVCVDGSKRLSSSREEPGVTQLKGSLGAFSITILGIKTNLSLNSMKFCLGPYWAADTRLGRRSHTPWLFHLLGRRCSIKNQHASVTVSASLFFVHPASLFHLIRYLMKYDAF